MDQLRRCASRLPRGPTDLLITHVGVAKVIVAPLRTLCPGKGLESDVEWLTTKAGEQEVEVGIAKLFARIELRAINYLADPTRMHTRNTRQAPFLCLCPKLKYRCSLRGYCLATRLDCLAHYLPSAFSQPALRIVDNLLVATVAGCAGGCSPTNLTAATQGRVLLAICFREAFPGAAATAPAQHVCSVAAVERSISEMVAALEQRGAAGNLTKCASAGAGTYRGKGSQCCSR